MARPRPHRTVLVRGLVAVAAGAIAGIFVEPWLGLAAALLAGWAALAVVSVAWVLTLVWGMDAAQTRLHATEEDPGRAMARLIALVGSIASLGAVGVVLLQTRNRPELEAFLLAGIAVAAVAASWALIQTDYMLRIAAVYYGDPVGGIDFNQGEDPMYSDFAYFAFGLGLAYQVGDTNVRTNALRRIVLGQTLLAYVFGAVVLATVINLVTGLG